MPHDPGGERTPVTQRAVERIKAMIAGGEVGPGERLPTERDLAVQLGVSRSSMREAIRALTTLGVLEARHGAGVYVTALRPADLLETFSVLAEVSQGQTLLEVLQVRRMLEPAATALAAARADARDLERIGALLERMDGSDAMDCAGAPGGAAPEGGTRPRREAPDGGVLDTAGADLGFHQAIVASTGNATLAAIGEGLSSRTFNARVWAGHREAGLTAALHEDHERIHEALVARDPDAARAAATVHVLRVERWLRADLAQGDGAGVRTRAPGR
ncbi:FadR/GntR family transcriptional regulator [Nocardiopsis tropica]|uniref:FCD domain-containing protein n=2 Tax=Nocardiopsis tropica TaxID=109330 RepID=A0ABU7KKD8_9ACTN|nr:FCD domain-containing protein [Nocardiopsis umidischolae]MEE2049763.1 FCD domain-containing protein [Nocardiopsis umidischolae]